MGKGSCRREAGKGENIGNGNKYNIQEEREKKIFKRQQKEISSLGALNTPIRSKSKIQ